MSDEAPVPLAEQPTASLAEQMLMVDRELRKVREFIAAHPRREGGPPDMADRDAAVWSAVLATLQQHERAMAVVDAALLWLESGETLTATKGNRLDANKAHSAAYVALRAVTKEYAALDGAANTAGDRSQQKKKDKGMDQDRCSTTSQDTGQPGCGDYECGIRFGAKLALIDHRTLQERASDLYAALAMMVERYTGLSGSGDCGNWNPEDEREVKIARAALAACPPTWRVNDRAASNTESSPNNSVSAPPAGKGETDGR